MLSHFRYFGFSVKLYVEHPKAGFCRTPFMYSSHKTRLEHETTLSHGYPHGFRSNLTVFTGTGFDKAAGKAVANWVGSSGHFEAMIDSDADFIGVGITTDGVKVCCYIFAGASNAYNPYAP